MDDILKIVIPMSGWGLASYLVLEYRSLRKKYSSLLGKYAIMADFQKEYVRRTQGGRENQNILGAQNLRGGDPDDL